MVTQKHGKLTDKKCRGAQPKSNRYDIRDSICSGLILRIQKTGKRSFVFRYTWGASRPEITIGQYPVISLTDARETCENWRALIRKGVDPRKPENLPQRSPRPMRPALTVTVAELCRDFRRIRYPQMRPSTRATYTAYLNRWILPELGLISLGALSRRDVYRFIDTITANASPGLARSVRSFLATVVDYGIERELEPGLEGNVVRSTKRLPGYKPRNRTLTDEEIRTLWTDAETGRRKDRGRGNMARLVLVTGKRITETALATWSQIDIKAKTWTIPPEHTKSARGDLVPLSSLAIELLESIAETTGRRGPLFEHWFKYVRAKRNADRAVGVYGLPQWCRTNHLEPFTWHDIRRTVAGRCIKLRGSDGQYFPEPVIDLILSHAPSGVTALHYSGTQIVDWTTEHSEALEVWARELRRICDLVPALAVAQ